VQPALVGGEDIFVVRLSATGAALVFSTYLGSLGSPFAPGGATSPNDRGNSIAWHDATLYIAGMVGGSLPSQIDLVGTPSGPPNAFVTALDSAGTRLIYSVALGGSRTDAALGLAVDGVGNIYLTGMTNSVLQFPPRGGVGESPFPTANAFQL